MPLPDLPTRLIDSAMDLLARGGSDALSLRGVARLAGVSAMAPYRHFADKEALLAAIAARGFAGLRSALHDADQGAAPGEALVAQAAAYVSYAIANPALFRLMFGPPRAGKHPKRDAAGLSAFGVLAQRIAAECDEEARHDMTLGCWSLVHGLALLFLDGQLADEPAAPADIARRVAEAMMHNRPLMTRPKIRPARDAPAHPRQ